MTGSVSKLIKCAQSNGHTLTFDQQRMLFGQNKYASEYLMKVFEQAGHFVRSAELAMLGSTNNALGDRLCRNKPIFPDQVDRMIETNRALRRHFYTLYGRSFGTFDKVFSVSNRTSDMPLRLPMKVAV